jgi:hypothetical protein
MIAFNYLFEVLSYIKSEDIKLFWKAFLKNFFGKLLPAFYFEGFSSF